MSVLRCSNCGRTTNTACSNWMDHPENKKKNYPAVASKCYAAFDDGKWVQGCGYEEANAFDKAFAAKLIREQ